MTAEKCYNACHFYNGVTIRVPVPATQQDTRGSVEEWPIMEGRNAPICGSRVAGWSYFGRCGWLFTFH
ncbi:hypothetical protein [Bacillus massiliigorillae]|uniref:hypothetical protein n=1 Tax=Bacillus massiliigorillae TaxID=1243664 RepID=UPI0012B5CA08|nr:hypothetical protein [Bacillus massiliigorillae]